MTVRLNLEREIGETWLFSFDYPGAQSVQSATLRLATRTGNAVADFAIGSGISTRDQAIDVKITPSMQTDLVLVSETYVYDLRVTLGNSVVDTLYYGSFYVDASPFSLPSPLPPGSAGTFDFTSINMSGLIILLEDI